MARLASWTDYLPDREQARDAVAAAAARAREDAGRAERHTPTWDVGAALGDAAAEAARLAVLVHPRHAADVVRPYEAAARHHLSRLTARSGVAAIAGGLAFASLCDGNEHAGIHLEQSPVRADHELGLIEAVARARPDSAVAARRTLALVALSTGRLDLVRALSREPHVERLASAIDALDPAPFYDLVEAFPTVEEIGHADLAAVARAFVVRFEQRLRGGASTWLHRLVHDGRPATLPRAVAPAGTEPIRAIPPPEVIEHARRIFIVEPRPGEWDFDPPARSWARITLHDVHARDGGRVVSVDSRGIVTTIEVAPWRSARAHRGLVIQDAVDEIDHLLAAHDLRDVPAPRRMLVPDEGTASITVVTRDGSLTVTKAANDAHPAFDLPLGWLHRVAAALAATTDPTDEGTWTGRFEPKAYPRPAPAVTRPNRAAPASPIPPRVSHRSTSQVARHPLGGLVLSPGGEHVLARHGTFRPGHRVFHEGATLVHRHHPSPTSVRLPRASDHAFVLDDGRVVFVDASDDAVRLAMVSGDGTTRTETLHHGRKLALEVCARLDVRRLVLGMVDRGTTIEGSDPDRPSHPSSWRVIDLETGAELAAGTDRRIVPELRYTRGPGSSFATPNQDPALELPPTPRTTIADRREETLAVGRRRFLTDTRLHELGSLEVVLEIASVGERESGAPRAVLTDLSHDERFALSISAEGVLTVWDVDGRSPLASVAEHGVIESARFGGPISGEIVLGNRAGELVVLGLD